LNAEVKLELARAAVEFAEASLAEERGDGWSAHAGGGSGAGYVDSFRAGELLQQGKSLEEVKALLDAGKVRREAMDAVMDRLGKRLEAARERYVLARRAAGFPRDPRNWKLMTKAERDAEWKATCARIDAERRSAS
jgi:hypothetical protein